MSTDAVSFLTWSRERFIKEQLALAPPADNVSTKVPALYLVRQAALRAERLRRLGLPEEVVEEDFQLTRRRFNEAMRLMAIARDIKLIAFFRPNELTRIAN